MLQSDGKLDLSSIGGKTKLRASVRIHKAGDVP